ncbi:shikimate kinase [Mariprofundus micogutta]|uniref:Shikimate kinase n=1 Tax=Mariprofundus micogutta TaxID=1921010 RepID=A0A1L8CQ18_9PROT|nr:shikimate kinase [Mariprofundus micogutta]GAV20973.1 shikimate kinase [Mariprofundus micogutta]
MDASTEQALPLRPILVGLMGSGKSSIGKRLAAKLDLPLIDLDEYIVEKADRSIPEIFEQDGELAFRKMETEALCEVISKPAVIATGGGAVLSETNRRILQEHSPVIWLKASPEFLARRIEGDSNRPLIAEGDTLKKLQEQVEVRYPLYEACADFVLPRGDMKKKQVLQAILEFLGDWQARR